MNREGQVWKQAWHYAPFVVLRSEGSYRKAHNVLYFSSDEPRWEIEGERPWEEVESMERIA